MIAPTCLMSDFHVCVHRKTVQQLHTWESSRQTHRTRESLETAYSSINMLKVSAATKYSQHIPISTKLVGAFAPPGSCCLTPYSDVQENSLKAQIVLHTAYVLLCLILYLIGWTSSRLSSDVALQAPSYAPVTALSSSSDLAIPGVEISLETIVSTHKNTKDDWLKTYQITNVDESAISQRPLTNTRYLAVLFERSEFSNGDLTKKKSLRVCVCVCTLLNLVLEYIIWFTWF